MIKIETIMKANFNIEKNVRNSRSISALSALRKLQSLGLIVIALIMGSMQVWGATTTASFSPTDFQNQGNSNNGGNISCTKSPITVSCDKGYGYSSTQTRLYQDGYLSITSSAGNIKEIAISFTSSNYQCGLNTSYTGLSTTSWTSSRLSGSAARVTSITVTYEIVDACTKSVTVSNGGSSTHGSITSITTSPVATCSSTATDRQVSIVVTPANGYIAPEDLSVGSTSGTVTSTKISRTDNLNGTFTFVYRYNQNDIGSISYNAACVAKTYTINLNDQDATTAASPTSITATFDSNTGLTGTVVTTLPTKTGYTFGGYYNATGGSGVQLINSAGEIVASASGGGKTYTDASKNWIHSGGVTVYAKWTEKALTNYRTSCVACEAPTSVSITGTNKYLGGQTISLTATPDGGTGTPSYQWQKKISGVWTDIDGATSANLQISSCTHANSGGYRCIVSTGEGCETKSHADGTDGYGVHVFSIHGKYTSDANYSDNEITWTSGTTGTATIHMDAKKTYLFKVWSNNGYYYGHGANTNEDFMFQPTAWDCGTGNREMRLFTTVEGDYTFTVNIEHGLDGSPYVNLQVGYPSVSHPNTGYVYVQKFSWTPRLHYWYNDANKLTEWNDDPSLASDQYVNICGTDYWCVPVIDYYCNFIAADHNGQTTGDQHTNSPHPGQRLYNDGSWKWGDFSTYTITYAGGAGSTGGPMEPHTGICPGSSQQLTANAFSKAYHTFNGWSDGNSHTYADQATITNIQNDINLTAQWTPEQYNITATLTNVTSTTSFPVAYIYTGSAAGLTYTFTAASGYCLPNDVTVSGSTYTWDKASGVLTLTGVITSNVSITVTAVQAYTVTFVHHDKGTYSGGSTEWIVPSNEATITLPTVTDVSCGFYDTFEGWIASGSEYSESTSKPATVYAGNSSYTVQGDVTLRALYSKCEGDGGSVYRKVTAIGDVTDGTYILVSNNSTPHVYSGHTDSNNYGDIVSGLTDDGDDYSSTLPSGAVPVTIAKGTETHTSHFTIKNGTKYFKAGSDIALQDTESWWQLTDGSNVNSKACPAGALQPVSATTYVMQEYNSNRFKTYQNTQSYYVFLYKLIDKCTKYYATAPSCVKPVGVHIVYNANGGEMTCSNQNKTYKVVDAENQYPQLASVQDFCTSATRTGYTLVGWNTQANGLGTTYNINQHYYNLPVSGELDGENWVTLNVYAMWASAVSFNLGNATGGTGVPAVVEEDGGFMLPEPTAAQIGTIPCGYSFYGWSESSVVSTTTKPALFMPGTKYTGSARTLYAVYRLAGEGSNPDLFSLSYMYNSTKYYVAAPSGITTAPSTWEYTKGDKFAASTNAEDAVAFGMKTNADHSEHKEIYWVYDGDEDEKAYLQYSSGASVQFNSEEDTYYQRWAVTGTNELTFQNYSSSRYLSGDNTEIGCPSTPNTYTFTKEEASTTTYTYATNPSCETTATLAFVTNGGTLNYPDTYDASNYVDLTVGTNVYLPTATYPGEWTFEGWMKGSEVTSTDMRPESANFIEVTLNTTTYSAAPAGTTTFYAVYSKTINDKQFDPVNGGTYKLFAIMADGTTKKYMPVWDGTQTTLTPVTSCASTGDYTITPGTGVHAGQYQITHGSYTLGVRDDANTQFKNVADAWWNIEASTSGKGTYRITVVGSSNRCLSHGGTGFFGNYTRNDVNNPGQPGYRDMEIGECIYTEYTSTPENIPYIAITGSPVKITSTKDERVYAPTKIHIEAHNFTGVRTIHLSATNGFATNPASVNTAANGAYSGDIDIYYQPTTAGDGSIVTSVLTASQIGGPAAEHVSQTFSAISGRNMPANFVIAVKSGEQWYALPDDCHSSGTPKAVPIEVNDPNAPTAASLVPHNTEWRLSDVVNSNSRPKDKVYFYEPNSTNDYTLYAGSAPNIQTNAQLSNVTGENSYTYEWGLTTSDLCAYTIGNANVGKDISINTAGTFGTHVSGIVSSTLYLLPITAYYETAAMQVLEWKTNSVVVMYTGTQTTATTKVGDNAASSAQTLSSQKLTHGIYELTTGQALTANAGAALKVSFGGGAEMAIVTIPIIVNSNVTVDADHASEDVIIVDGGKLTAAATKYSYRNIYVYGGGKLKIASGSQLGVNNIILRAGGVTTNGSGGSATYAYTYPQVELGGTLSSTQTNIKYEYITDYDHWYQLCLPFNGTLNSIHYPQEYYGDNVTAANTGSWIIKRYAGEVRATGNYNAWKDIETEGATSVTAGHGYIFWGAPKKVSVGGTAKQRQQWGIQRMTMPITSAAAATTAETNDKNIYVDSYSDVEGKSTKPNDQGWNLVGNPYMVNLTNLSSESMIAGQLVHTETVPWDGKWRNNGDGIRYVTIPDNHFDNYEAKTASVAAGAGYFMPGRAFFVQIAEGATTLTFAATNRASLMPALYAKVEESVDIETGVVLSDETKHDEVNFWIKDGKTAEYEYNADYPKTPNSSNFNLYGVHSHGDLSWIAISPEIAEGSMAIGYQVPTAGEYRLSLSETYVSDKIEHLLVTDHEMSPEITTNLLVEDYLFQVNQAETNNERFTVSIKIKSGTNTATDIDDIRGDSEHPYKFLFRDKMYIKRGDRIFDATGKQVREIK